jgi:hypothetical protein
MCGVEGNLILLSAVSTHEDVKRNAKFRVECMEIKAFWDMTLSTGNTS